MRKERNKVVILESRQYRKQWKRENRPMINGKRTYLHCIYENLNEKIIDDNVYIIFLFQPCNRHTDRC